MVIFEWKELKDNFDNDKPIEMMCQKCSERSMELIQSGMTDDKLILEILKDMGRGDKMAG